MVTGEWMRQKLVEPLKEKQRQEGVELADSSWRAWNNRRLEAEAKGEHFDEPTPQFQNNTQNRNGSKE